MQTETVDYSYSRRALAGDAYSDRFLGRQAVFTTWEGGRLVGTVTGVNRDGYLVVTFGDGRWARLDETLELVRV